VADRHVFPAKSHLQNRTCKTAAAKSHLQNERKMELSDYQRNHERTPENLADLV